MKQVEFDIELVKKIQNGEIKGVIQTTEGQTVRFLGEIKDPIYPLVFARKLRHSSGAEEALDTYTLTGKYSVKFDEHVNDIIIEIEEEIEEERQKSEHQFKPFDKVLVRDDDNEEWSVGIYSHYTSDCDYPYFCAGLTAMRQCIPYEGNQELVGTTKTPKDYGGK